MKGRGNSNALKSKFYFRRKVFLARRKGERNGKRKRSRAVTRKCSGEHASADLELPVQDD